MLSLTKKTGCGLMALTFLAKSPRRLLSARAIAERFSVSTGLLMNVLKELAAAGYVESVRGAHGGYRLARPAEEITLADILCDIEGPIPRSTCLRPEAVAADPSSCRRAPECPVSDPVHLVHRRLRGVLEAITLADIMEPDDVSPRPADVAAGGAGQE